MASRKGKEAVLQPEEERSLIEKDDGSTPGKGKGLTSNLSKLKVGSLAKGGKATKKEPTKPKRSCWSLITNFNFLFFVFNSFTPIGVFVYWFIMPESPIPFIVAGALGLLITLNGMRAISSIVALMKECSEFSARNEQLTGERANLEREVAKFRHANEQLGSARDDFQRSAQKNKELRQNMSNLKHMMESMNIQDFEEMKEKCYGMVDRWQGVRMEKERSMLNSSFDQVESYLDIFEYICIWSITTQ